jgi:ribosomal protein S18 acetylase RimI-like enzyme
MFKKLFIEQEKEIFEILKQDGVRGYNGEFASSENEWFMHFFDTLGCFVYGWEENEELIAVLIAELMSGNGCMLWYIAVKPEKQRQGYGSKLLNNFEQYIKTMYNVKWIYLTASKNSLDFYKKHEYVTSKYSNVFEHVKNF